MMRNRSMESLGGMNYENAEKNRELETRLNITSDTIKLIADRIRLLEDKVEELRINHEYLSDKVNEVDPLDE